MPHFVSNAAIVRGVFGDAVFGFAPVATATSRIKNPPFDESANSLSNEG
jgi:hypothetical protein